MYSYLFRRQNIKHRSIFLSQNFSIAVVSDTGAEDIVLETMLQEIVNTQPKYDFILHLGDFFNTQNKYRDAMVII